MKAFIFTFLFCLSQYCILSGQLEPRVFVEGDPVTDVLHTGDGLLYSTSTGVKEYDGFNTVAFEDDNGPARYWCSEGRFFEQANGWAHVGWYFLNDDHTLPSAIVSVYDGERFDDYYLGYFSAGYLAVVEAATFVSTDSIYLLANNGDDWVVMLTNLDGDILNESKVDDNGPYDMILIGRSTNLVVAWHKVIKVTPDGVTKERTFGGMIKDVNFSATSETIQVLTEEKIVWLDTNLNVLKEIALPDSGRSPRAIKTAGRFTYLIEKGQNQSHISKIDSVGTIVDEHTSQLNFTYHGLEVHLDEYSVWGNNNCSHTRNFLKYDTAGFDLPIPTVDLAIEDLVVAFLYSEFDTINTGSGNPIIITRDHFSWQMDVVNRGTDLVEEFTIRSSTFFNMPPDISIAVDEALAVGDSRTFSGELVNSRDFSGDNLIVSVFAEEMDSNCSDNRVSADLVVSAKEEAINKVRVFPNPTADKIELVGEGAMSYILYDHSGRLLSEGHVLRSGVVDLSGFSAGLYLLKVQTKDGLFLERVVRW